MSGEAASKARANKRQKKYPSQEFLESRLYTILRCGILRWYWLPSITFSPWESTLFLTAFLSVYVEDVALSTKGNKATSDFISVNSKCSPAEENIYNVFGQEYSKSMAAWTENHGRCRKCYELISSLSASWKCIKPRCESYHFPSRYHFGE